jgi:hypothetical protein
MSYPVKCQIICEFAIHNPRLSEPTWNQQFDAVLDKLIYMAKAKTAAHAPPDDAWSVTHKAKWLERLRLLEALKQI